MGNGSSARGCGGSRDAGGIYLEAGSAGGTVPLWTCICDPVQPIDVEALDLSPVGVKLIEINGVTHVFDWVGATHYPNAADFLEEFIRLGLSRRISRKEDFRKLTSASKIFLIHPQAYFAERPPFIDSRLCPCPTGKHDPESHDPACSGYLWQIAEPGATDLNLLDGNYEPPAGLFPTWAPKPVEPGRYCGTREMPAFTYTLGERGHNVDLQLLPGVIAVCPIEAIAVVDNPADPEGVGETLGAARESSLPVKLEDK